MSGEPQKISNKLIDTIHTALKRGNSIRRRLPKGGLVHIDRLLPFLVIYRQPDDHDDVGTERLLLGEASYVRASANPSLQGQQAKLIREILQAQTEHFGRSLMVEIWAGSEPHEEVTGPGFHIYAPRRHAPSAILEELESDLLTISINRIAAEVQITYRDEPSPSGMPALLSGEEAKAMNCTVVGLEARPVYRNEQGTLFPFKLKNLQRGLTRALKRSFYIFAHASTTYHPVHYHELGRRAMTQAVRETDRRLAKISSQFDLLLHISPVNVSEAAHAFLHGRRDRVPEFLYRPRPVDPGLLKRELYKIPLERIEDPTLAHIFAEKREELDRHITLVADRNTPRFLLGSRQIFGDLSTELLTLARDLLSRIPADPVAKSADSVLDVITFASIAEQEISHYRQQDPTLAARVEVREDVPGIMVSKGNFLIGRNATIVQSRVKATLAHEIGTHVLTYHNGCQQPLSELYTGMAGYEPMQEGTAVISEYLVGGLDPSRLRLLAGRVLAVDLLINGADFIETFRVLHNDHGFSEEIAFMVTMRVHRGGGFTKDAVYLDGLTKVMGYIAEGHKLERLYLGKIAHEYLDLIEELQWRQVLRAPKLRPHFLESPESGQRLARLRKGITAMDLLEGAA